MFTKQRSSVGANEDQIFLWLYNPLLDLGRFFQFLNPIHSRWDSLDGGSAHRKAVTYTQNNTNRVKAHTDIYALSGIRIHDLSVQASEDGS
jgi:hypothetical protein